MLFFTAVAAFATASMAVFNYQLVQVSRDMHKATEDAATAAMKSAEVAEAALDTNRPYLFVTEVHVRAISGVRDGWVAHITLENFGSGPADLVDYVATGGVYDAPIQNPDPARARPDPLITYADNEGTPYTNVPIRPGKSAPDCLPAEVVIDPADKGQLPDKRRIAFHGRVRYRGTTNRVYITRFFWWWFHPEADQCDRCLTREYNSRT